MPRDPAFNARQTAVGLKAQLILRVAWIMKTMNFRGYSLLFVGLAIALALVMGCTAPAGSPSAPAPATTPQPAASQAPAYTPQYTATPTAASATGASIDTTVNVRNNGFTCLDVQQGLGVDYLYEDQKYSVTVGLPLNGNVNVNALVLDTEDKTKMGSVPPKWDDVKKAWVYDGLVPLLQFNDITTPQQKTITIKRQGQFYLCIDDRKETGGEDVTYKVPVTFTRVY